MNLTHKLVVCLAFGGLSLLEINAVNTWSIPDDFSTIQEAVDASPVLDDDIIIIANGRFSGATVDKRLVFIGSGSTIIDDGPIHGSGLVEGFHMLQSSSNSELKNILFETDLQIYNGEAAEGIVVDHCTFRNAIQAISNWSGNGWQIRHNIISDLRTRCGGGIGILIADRTGGTVEGNIVEHNKIEGTLYVDPSDCGGYDGSGIVLYADFRWGRMGATSIKDNFVLHNSASVVSNDKDVVDIVAMELTDSRDGNEQEACAVIYDNAVGFNDWRGTTNTEMLTPGDLANCNFISRNIFSRTSGRGGHGVLHPSQLMPN